MIAEYEKLVGHEYMDQIKRKARILKGKSILHVNATKYGGGVAEILQNMIPLMKELKLDAKWEAFSAPDSFFEVSKKIHNAIQGDRNIHFTDKEIKTYISHGKRIEEEIKPNADFVIIHDPQPAPIIHYAPNRKGKWIWRCHIDSSDPNPQIWSTLSNFIPHYDAVIFHKKEFARENVHRFVYTMPPSINPFSEKNREMKPFEIKEIMQEHVPLDLPIITQVSRFDPWKDPLGVVDAYRIIREKVKCRLVFIGSLASDDPEGQVFLEKLKDHVGNDPLIHIFSNLDGFHDKEVNAFQRGSAILIQKSLKEGFGLTVTEGMWKEKALVAGNVGGIKLQITDGQDGFLVNSVEETARRCIYLLENPDIAERMGKQAKKKVKDNFLLINHLNNYLDLFIQLMERENK